MKVMKFLAIGKKVGYLYQNRRFQNCNVAKEWWTDQSSPIGPGREELSGHELLPQKNTV